MPPDRIVLVAPGARKPQVGGALLHLPLALLSLAAWLEKDPANRGRIDVVDMRVRDLRDDDFTDAMVVGISAMTGRQIRHGLEAARRARAVRPETPIIWGGIHPSLLPEQTARHALVDAVVVGEGEETFREVVAAVAAGGNIAGIPGTCVFTMNGEIVRGPERPFIDMDDMPLPAYDLVDMAAYHGIEHQFDYQSSRGCPFRCGFCYNTVFCGRRWRKKSAEKVIADLFVIAGRHPVRNFAFDDDEFFIDLGRAERIIDTLAERDAPFGIVASCRLDIIRKAGKPFLEKLKQAGVVQLFFGAESGSKATLGAIGKDIDTDDIIEGARLVAESGIRPVLSFMSGFPGETFAEFEKTLGIIDRLWDAHPLITVNGIFPFNAYPGTALFEDARRRGLKVPETLDAWGDWTFQYEPDNPWLDERMKCWMQISFYIVRFRYYLARFEDRHRGKLRVPLVKACLWPWTLSAKLRWRRRWFRFAWEWRVFAWAARTTFGYL